MQQLLKIKLLVENIAVKHIRQKANDCNHQTVPMHLPVTPPTFSRSGLCFCSGHFIYQYILVNAAPSVIDRIIFINNKIWGSLYLNPYAGYIGNIYFFPFNFWSIHDGGKKNNAVKNTVLLAVVNSNQTLIKKNEAERMRQQKVSLQRTAAVLIRSADFSTDDMKKG